MVTQDATLTTTGWVPHLQWMLDACVVSAPVKLRVEATANGGRRIALKHDGSADQRLPTALRRDGRLVYALPGGLEVCP